MPKLARWCFRHRVLVLAGWLVALLAVSAAAHSAGSKYSNSFSLPGTQSSQAMDLLQKAAPSASGDVDQIVVQTADGKVTDPAVRLRVEAALAKVARLPHVVSVGSPYTAAGARQVSAGGTIAFATVALDEQAYDVPKDAVTAVIDAAKTAQSPDVRVELGGGAIEQANNPALSGVGFGILAAAIVLFLVFGSLLGMILPLITALVSLGTALGLVGLLSHALTTASYTPQLALLIGLGVGVDYALFIVSRYRQGLLAGQSPEDAAATAADTSGRAVVFAGITVCIAVLGMFALGIDSFYSLAAATAVAVAFTVVAALTLLPALLGMFGLRVLSRRARRRPAGSAAPSRRWTAWARALQRRPVAFAAAGIAVMALFAVPLASMHLGTSDQGNDPAGTTTRQAYDLLAKGFGPGFNGPLQLVVPVTDPARTAAELPPVLSAISRQPGVAAVGAPVAIGRPGGTRVDVVTVYPATSPQDTATADLVKRLRGSVIPAATRGTGLTVLVGGLTAISVDFSQVITGKLVLFVGAIILLSFLLLVMVFRSLLIPVTAAVMNLLSAGAAFGIITAVFQWGWGKSLLGIEDGPVETFGPVLIFAILFGLSMDYEVFLVSRMHEKWQHTRDNAEAVGGGVAEGGRVIAAAATIMILVFGSFILGGLRVIKLFGFGLAAAVLLDALVIRLAVVPSLMFLSGQANWYLPAAVSRVLPRLSVEPAPAQPAVEPAVEPALD
jgi:RND superfamily putative drug exporter